MTSFEIYQNSVVNVERAEKQGYKHMANAIKNYERYLSE